MANSLLLHWDGLTLRFGNRRGRALLHVVPDSKWPEMYRVRYPDGRLSDMVNLSRAKDAASRAGLALVERGYCVERRREGGRTRFPADPLPDIGPALKNDPEG